MCDRIYVRYVLTKDGVEQKRTIGCDNLRKLHSKYTGSEAQEIKEYLDNCQECKISDKKDKETNPKD